MGGFEDLITDGQNNTTVVCNKCKTLILSKMSAKFTDAKYDLPAISLSKDDSKIVNEEISASWEIDNMYTFANIGFSKNVENVKYLICADCEIGPLGYHDLTTKKCFVAIKRVEHSH